MLKAWLFLLVLISGPGRADHIVSDCSAQLEPALNLAEIGHQLITELNRTKIDGKELGSFSIIAFSAASGEVDFWIEDEEGHTVANGFKRFSNTGFLPFESFKLTSYGLYNLVNKEHPEKEILEKLMVPVYGALGNAAPRDFVFTGNLSSYFPHQYVELWEKVTASEKYQRLFKVRPLKAWIYAGFTMADEARAIHYGQSAGSTLFYAILRNAGWKNFLIVPGSLNEGEKNFFIIGFKRQIRGRKIYEKLPAELQRIANAIETKHKTTAAAGPLPIPSLVAWRNDAKARVAYFTHESNILTLEDGYDLNDREGMSAKLYNQHLMRVMQNYGRLIFLPKFNGVTVAAFDGVVIKPDSNPVNLSFKGYDFETFSLKGLHTAIEKMRAFSSEGAWYRTYVNSAISKHYERNMNWIATMANLFGLEDEFGSPQREAWIAVEMTPPPNLTLKEWLTAERRLALQSLLNEAPSFVARLQFYTTTDWFEFYRQP
jgi:hypothetical protein